MLLVDEYVALPALAGRAPQPVQGQALAITYGRAYRLTRALLDPAQAGSRCAANSPAWWTASRRPTSTPSTSNWPTPTLRSVPVQATSPAASDS